MTRYYTVSAYNEYGESDQAAISEAKTSSCNPIDKTFSFLPFVQKSPSSLERIIFSSDKDGDLELFSVLTDGSELKQLTDNKAWDGDPICRRGGTQFTFNSKRAGQHNMYIMDVLTGTTERIGEEDLVGYEPSWSPDGQYFVFSTGDTDRIPGGDIYTMNVDGSELNLIKGGISNDADPSWSPDGKSIVFTSNESGKFDIYTMTTEGKDIRQYTSGLNAMEPSWSPDGKYIAFSDRIETDERITRNIYIVDVTSGELKKITDDDWDNADAEWSPDGTWIVFHSDRDGDHEIYIMRSNGTEIKRVTNNDVLDWGPCWLP